MINKKQQGYIILIAITTLIVASITIYSRNEAKRQSEIKRIKDIEYEKQQAKLQKITDSLSLIAWGDIQFGATREQVNNSNQFKGMKKCTSYNSHLRYSAPYSTRKEIKEAYELFYYTPQLFVEFGGENNNELIKISLENTYDVDDFTYFVRDYKKIAHHLTSTYGKPSYSNLDDNPILFTGDFETMARWEISNKNIVLYVTLTRDYKYEFIFSIYNTDFPKTVNIEEEKAKAEKTKKQQEQLSNMF